MRKLFSLLLALTMLVSTMSVAFAAPADVTNEDQMEAVDVLMALGVVDGYPDGTYRPENVVTRGEMAKLIVTILGYKSIATSNNTSFTDMESHWAKGFVEVCVGLGIVKGYTDGSFRADSTVTYNEAATMIVRALGYTDEALGGTWPTNYVTKAMDKDIFDDVSTLAGGANRGDIAIMLYNALLLNIGTVNQDGDYVEEAGDTMMARLDGVKVEDQVVFGSEDTLINLRPYVGKHADYYKYDGDVILVVLDETEIEGDFVTADDTFEDVVKDYTLKNDKDVEGAEVFLNGDYADTMADSEDVDDIVVALSGADHWVLSGDISGVTVKTVYGVVRWELTQDFQFEDDDATDIDEDQELQGMEFELTDDEEIDMDSFELMGADSLEDITEDAVVYVYEGSDYIRKIVVGTETVSGEVTRINNDEDAFTIDGVTYDLSEFNIATLPAVEDEVKAILDGYGEIYNFEDIDSDQNFAVVLEFDDGEGVGLNDDDAVIKLLLQDGSTETFVADGADLALAANGGLMNSNEYTWVTALTAGHMVEYAVNSDGELDELYARNTFDPSNPDVTTAMDKDISTRGYYNSESINESVVAFGFDDSTSTPDVTDEDNYSVISYDSLLGLETVESTYYVDPDDGDIVFMIVNDYDAGADDVFALVQDYTALADDMYEVTYYIDGDEVVYDTTNDDFVVGMIGEHNGYYVYELDFNAAGEVDGLNPVAEISSKGAMTVNDISSSKITFSDLSTITVDSSIVIYKYDGSDDFDIKSKRNLENETANVTVYLFDLVDDDGVADTIVYKMD